MLGNCESRFPVNIDSGEISHGKSCCMRPRCGLLSRSVRGLFVLSLMWKKSDLQMQYLGKRLKKVILAVAGAGCCIINTACCYAASNDWLTLMRDGSSARNRLEFDKAQTLLQEAEAVSFNLSDEERLLSLMALGFLAEDRGDYKGAENSYRQAIQLPGSDDAKIALLNLLEKSGRDNEATELRKSTPFHDADEYKTAVSSVDKLRVAINRTWTPRLLKMFPNVGSYQALLVGEESWTCVWVYVRPKQSFPVVYVRASSGNLKYDSISLDAAQKTEVSSITSGLAFPLTFEQTFDYDRRPPAEEKHAKPYVTDRYRTHNELIAWQQNTLGSQHPEVAVNLTAAAILLDQLSQSEPAIKALAKAVEIWDSRSSISMEAWFTYKQYGEVLAKKKRFDEALPPLRKAFKLAQVVFKGQSQQLLDTKALFVKSLEKTGNSAEARSIRQQE